MDERFDWSLKPGQEPGFVLEVNLDPDQTKRLEDWPGPILVALNSVVEQTNPDRVRLLSGDQLLIDLPCSTDELLKQLPETISRDLKSRSQSWIREMSWRYSIADEAAKEQMRMLHMTGGFKILDEFRLGKERADDD